MKIKILYSHLNVGPETDYKARPEWFNFEKSFQNFLSTITPSNELELHIIYDTTRGSLDQNWISKYNGKIIFHEIQGGSMFAAAKKMYEIAKELSSNMEDTDLFYFLENDYLHINGWVNKIKELYKEYGEGLNYISLYDHYDKYILPQYDNLISNIFVSNSHHWRLTPSTCGSYIVSKKIFLEDYDIHTSLEGDHNRWVSLNDQRNRFILSALPGLSTHVMNNLMSPTIDWKLINDLK